MTGMPIQRCSNPRRLNSKPTDLPLCHIFFVYKKQYTRPRANTHMQDPYKIREDGAVETSPVG